MLAVCASCLRCIAAYWPVCFPFSPQRSMRSTEVHCLLSSRVRRRHGKSSICVSEVRWPNKHCGLHTSTQWIEWQLGIPCSGKLSRPSSGRAGEASQARAGVPVLAPSLPLTPRDGAQDGRELGVPSIFISWNSKFVVCASGDNCSESCRDFPV